MAEQQFAATLEECCQILQSILDRGDVYALEGYVRDPAEAEQITSITPKMRERWSSLWYQPLYLFGSYSIYPPRYLGSGDRYCVESLAAGPYLGFGLNPPKQGLLSYRSSIFTEPFYRIPDTETFLTPLQLQPLREAYADCVRRAKKFLVRHTLQGSDHKLWIGREARELLESGALCLGWGKQHYSGGIWYPGERPKRWPVTECSA